MIVRATLADLAASEPGAFVDGPFGSHLKASEYVAKGVPVMRIQNVRPNAYLNSETRYITSRKADSLSRHGYRAGDVVITKLGEPCGVACQVPAEAAPGIIVADVVRFRGREDRIDHRYLVHFLNSPDARRQVAGLAKGTTRQRVNLSDLRKVRVSVPPIAEQRRIAVVLDKADGIRRKRRESLRLLDEFLRSAFLEMFGDPVRSNKGWDVVQVEQMASNVPNPIAIGPFGSDLKVADYRNDGHPVVFVQDIKRGRFQRSSAVYVSAEKFHQFASHRVSPGDVVVTKMGSPPGIAAVYPTTMPVGVVTADIIRMVCDRRVCAPEYVSAAINSSWGQAQLVRITEGVTRPKVTLRDFRSLKLPLPPLALQDRYVAVVASVDRSRERLTNALTEADALFDSLAQWAFRVEL